MFALCPSVSPAIHATGSRGNIRVYIAVRGAERNPPFSKSLPLTRISCHHADGAVGKYTLLVNGTNAVLDASTTTGPCSVAQTRSASQRMDITKIVDEFRVSSRN